MRFGNLIWIGTAIASAALAQDPPSRVARLSYLKGPVSFQPATVDDWSAATLNYPLTTGDHLYADQSASAEVGIGPNFIRIAHQTNFGFLNLDDRTVQVRLTEGSVSIHVRALDDQDVWEVDTPNGAVTLLRAGDYRIDTDPARNATMVTVRGGDAEVTANGQSFPVHARQTGYFTGDGQQQSIQNANPPDEFDLFAQDRDREENAAPPPQYVSQNMVGYEDLNRYGSWEPQSEYGPIWRPRVAAGWAPYHDGRWVWREPWGWTWVDEAPWGFAPFHYGRWAYVGGGWGWCPGAVVVARPVYAPALVAFVGGRVGVGVGVGWFPLGPREVYAPAYHVSPAYVRNVNVLVVNRNVTNVYVNRNIPGAVTAVSREDFVGARSVQRSARVDAGQFRSAPVAGFTPGYAPQRQSVFGREAGNVARPQQGVFNRQVIARTPLPPSQVPFAARQQALQGNGGRPLAAEQLNTLRSNQPAPQQPPVRFSGQRNEGFGRNSAQPQTATQPEPQPRDNNRPQDRFERRPPQAAPQAAAPAAPQAAAPAPNRGFERPPQQQDRSERRQQQQPATPAAPQETPAPNRGFGRAPQAQREPTAPAASPTPAQAPREEPRQFGRQPNSPAAERPRAERPRAERPADEKKKEEKKP